MEQGKSIYLISGSYPPKTCGIADYVQNLASALNERGSEVTIITSQANDSEPWEVIGLGDIKPWSVIRLVRKSRPQVVHLQYQMGVYGDRAAICFMPLILRLFTKSRIVTTFHDLNGPSGWRRLHRLGVLLTLLGSHRAVVCSNKQLEGLSHLPLIGRKVKRIPVGPTIVPVEKPLDRTLRHGEIRILHFGFLWRNRGLESVISACAAAANNGFPVRLILAGSVVDQDYPQELIKLAESLGLPVDSMIFTGTLPSEELSRIMYNSDFAVLPFPTGVSSGRSTFVSCASHGLPIITSYDPINCPQELINGENVLMYETGDKETLVKHVMSLCADTHLRQKLAMSIIDAVSDAQWPQIAEAHAQIYKSAPHHT